MQQGRLYVETDERKRKEISKERSQNFLKRQVERWDKIVDISFSG